MKLGILGGGQLARMLALSGFPLGIPTLCLEPVPATCAADVTPVMNASLENKAALDEFTSKVDCITVETENIPLACAEYVASKKPFYPSVNALAISQDRLLEKNFLCELGIPTANYFAVNSYDTLTDAVNQLATPAFLKTRRMGYDGKGQYLLRSREDIENAWQTLACDALILEQKVEFDCELSLISVRSRQGEIRFYPLVKNTHYNSILHCSEAPFAEDQLQNQAQRYAKALLDALNYVGVLTIEFFCKGNQLLVNELAPRVHNSGHLTIEGSHTSQFENHLRAIFGLPLGSTLPRSNAFMLNCLGKMPEIADVLCIEGASLHDYHKAPRPQRKVGHITLSSMNENQFTQGRAKLLAMLEKKSQLPRQHADAPPDCS